MKSSAAKQRREKICRRESENSISESELMVSENNVSGSGESEAYFGEESQSAENRRRNVVSKRKSK